MKDCKISVIVPSYNNGEYIKKCLDSLRFQTYENLEIICVDDGSTDNSRDILEEYKNLDKRIIPIYQENSGAANARNRGLEVATGDYISFIDADDWVLLTLYQTFINALSKCNCDLDIYMFNCASWMADENDIFPLNFFEISDWNNHKSEYTIHTFDDCQKPFTRNMSVANKIYRSEFLKQQNIKFPAGLKYEDIAFCLESFFKADSILVNEDVFYRYRNKAGDTASTEVVPKVFDIFKIVDLVENSAMTYGDYESLKYALFQFKYNIYSSHYMHCPENLKEAYYNEMKFRLIAAQTSDLDSKIFSRLKNYGIFEVIKNSSRKQFDVFCKKNSC